MAWDFETDPELQSWLDWIEPLDRICSHSRGIRNPLYAKRAQPLPAETKKEAA